MQAEEGQLRTRAGAGELKVASHHKRERALTLT